MGRLQELYPSEVFTAFEEICAIPHGSYNIDEISDYLKACAESMGFECIQDKEKNIIIRVPASEGYEKEPVLIIQGHMDMVAVHCDKNVDMKKHILEPEHDDEWVYARDSSLGGDDGIAVAMMMAIMRDKTIVHPELELLITTNEEVGMDGAVGLDTSLLKGKRLLNLDSEDEGIFTVGCAGGVRVVAHYPFKKGIEIHKEAYKGYFEVRGLQGGHSGQMIHKGRANACRVAARVLYSLADLGVGMCGISAGTAANAIANEAHVDIEIPESSCEEVLKTFSRLEKEIKHEYHGKDDGLELFMSPMEKVGKISSSAEETKRFAAFIIAEPDGIQAMSGAVSGLVETSLNIGILKSRDDEGPAVTDAVFELRSMIGSAAAHLKDRVVEIAHSFGAETEVSSSYPEWEYREESPLRDKMKAVFKEMYGREPVVEVIHAGLECGVLAKKIDGFDAVSIGPDMNDIHTVNERLNIASVGRCWDYVKEVLKRKD